jgi:putative phosphoribosyl transferase
MLLEQGRGLVGGYVGGATSLATQRRRQTSIMEGASMQVDSSTIGHKELTAMMASPVSEGRVRADMHAASLLLDWQGLRAERCPHLVAFTKPGMMVAQDIARICNCPLDYAAVAELPPCWPGGPVLVAAAFDGTVIVDEELRSECEVSVGEQDRLLEKAYERVASLLEAEAFEQEFPDLSGKTAIVVDDGLSSELATRVAIAAVRNAGARRVVLALPKGARKNVQPLWKLTDRIYRA